MSRAYLSRKLTRPLPTKDGGTLRTVLDARAYMFRLSKDREQNARWQRVAQLLLAKADVGAVSRQLELALLHDAKLDVEGDGMKTRAHFTFRVDTWTPDGESIAEHVACIEDYQVALATYYAACHRWPGTPITLRQGARVIEDSRRLRTV
jgi:hypothetical protein